MPMEKNPTRVVLSEEHYQALLKVSQEVTGGSMSRSCSRTRPDTASEPSASSSGPTSTWRVKPSVA